MLPATCSVYPMLLSALRPPEFASCLIPYCATYGKCENNPNSASHTGLYCKTAQGASQRRGGKMNKLAKLTTSSGNLAAVAPSVSWRTALTTFLDTLGSPRTVRAYERAVIQGIQAMGADVVADLTPPMLAEYRAGLVARLDADREDRLSPSTVSLKLGALRSFLHFCRLTGVTPLSKDVIAFVLKSPRAEVCKPNEVLSEGERRRFLEALPVGLQTMIPP